jgi:hypothetical protein
MSVRSSYTITRNVAIQVLMRHLMEAGEGVLEEMLEQLPQSTFRSYRIKEHSNDEDRHVDTVEKFYLL